LWVVAANWWKVQPFWDHGGERRHYRGVYCDSRVAAEAEAEDMRRTLSHFPGLEVLITPATDADVRAEVEERERHQAAAATTTVHLRAASGAAACGTSAQALLALELWELSAGPKCPVCEELAAAQLG
jgi:hypothetical protein